MKTSTNAMVASLAAGAMAVSTATPAMARDGRGDGIDAGDVIAGALIIGGIAAVAAAASDRDGDRYDGRYDGRYDYGKRGDRYGYGYGMDSRNAVQACVQAAESRASRYSWGGRADVTDIRSVDRTRDGYTVKGRIAVNTMGRGWRSGDARYGRGWGGDYRGWRSDMSGYDAGTFKCKISYGGHTRLDFSGIRGL